MTNSGISECSTPRLNSSVCGAFKLGSMVREVTIFVGSIGL
jgi:hypothetical protein